MEHAENGVFCALYKCASLHKQNENKPIFYRRLTVEATCALCSKGVWVYGYVMCD